MITTNPTQSTPNTLPRRKVVLVNPCFGKQHELMIDFYSFLLKTVSKYSSQFNYNIEQIRGNGGLNHATMRYMYQRKNRYDLMFLHHAEKRYFSKVIDFKLAYFPNLWYFNNGGFSGFSEISNKDLLTPVDDNILNSFYETEVQNWIKSTKYFMLQTEVTSLPKKYLFIPLQVANDTVMKLTKIDTEEMCKRVVEVSQKTRIPVILKIHPKSQQTCKNRKLAHRLVKDLDNIYLSTGDIRHLIHHATAVFVINSGVGFESICNLKNTYTFGKSDYSQATRHEYDVPSILSTLNSPVDEKKIKTFIYNWAKCIINLNDKDNAENKILDVLTSKLS